MPPVPSPSGNRAPTGGLLSNESVLDAKSKLPFLPGNQFIDINKSEFHKTQTLGFKNGYQVPKDAEVMAKKSEIVSPESVAKLLAEAATFDPELIYGKARLRNTENVESPEKSGVQDDKIVLRYFAYFKQTLHDALEPYLLRKVKILYYVEDDSIAVLEPPHPNSGIMQGVLIKRQRLPKSSHELFAASDFNVGINVTFYAKTFHIYDCDEFTRKYMMEVLNLVPNKIELCPKDPYLDARVAPSPHYLRHPRDDKLSRFLQQDRLVLRFYCVWPEEQRNFIIHYYLVDDCVEVLEQHKSNDGRDLCPLLLKRQQLPKTYGDLNDLKEGEFFDWKELRIGMHINVLNRGFFIYACDKFTRRYYEDNLGIQMTSMTPPPPAPPAPARSFPPYNGFGSEDDSLQSCKHLVLQPPKKIFAVEQDAAVLRFLAELKSRHREDNSRHFVISVFVSDNTLSVYEPPQRNSGILGGKFAERCRMLKPGRSMQDPEYYSSADFFIGAIVMIHGHCFEIYDADECVFKYMEQHADRYPCASVTRACLAVKNKGVNLGKQIVELLSKKDASLEKLKKTFGESMLAHEIITIWRNKENAIQLLQ